MPSGDTMAQEYVLIQPDHAHLGQIALTKEVFEMIARIACEEEDGVAGLDVGPLKSPVLCKIQDNLLNVHVEVKIKYGSNVSKVCEDLQQKIFQAVLQMTDLKCNLIDIKVAGFAFNAH